MAVSLREVVSFGRYEPLFRIASGGMAEVYAARIRGEAGFQKLVAVKRMHPHLATDPSFVDMFLNEARLAAHVASPYVVQTLDLGRGSDGSLYIVMELVVGLSLAKLAEDRRRPVPVPVAIELIAQAAQGLDDAHEATTPAGDPLGLVHRDVSPHNVLLGLDGRARVTDFGIAHAIHRPRAETNVKELKGKFGYMSPEQTRVKPLDRRSDLFSLGIVAWELLVGRRLFIGSDAPSSIRNVREMKVPSPRDEVPDVPEAVARAVLKALERDPDARFATGAEMAEALRAAVRASGATLPNRKAIAAFVKDAGGDELERLRRLIRLGTEGANADAMEKVQPGATRVLPRDGSGVSRIGAPGTERIDDDEAPPSPESVVLSEDDIAEVDDASSSLERALEPESDLALDAPPAPGRRASAGQEIPTDVLLGMVPDEEPGRASGVTVSARPPRERRNATPAPVHAPPPVRTFDDRASRVGSPAAPLAEPPRAAPPRAAPPVGTDRRRLDATPRPAPPPPDAAETRDYRAMRDAAVAVASPRAGDVAVDEPPTTPWTSDRLDEPPTKAWMPNQQAIAPPRVESAAPAAETSWKQGAILGTIAGLLLVVGVVLAILLWPEEPRRVPLPIEPTAAEAPEVEGASSDTAGASGTTQEEERERAASAEDREDEDDPNQPEAAGPTRASPRATARTRRSGRPPARRRPDPAPAERRPIPPAAGDAPVLLDVDRFDQHAP